jgi:hypothetical protein
MSLWKGFIYIFIFTLFNGYIGNSHYIASNYWMIVNNELEIMQIGADFASFKISARNLPEGIEGNYVEPRNSRDSIQGPLEYTSEAWSQLARKFYLFCGIWCSHSDNYEEFYLLVAICFMLVLCFPYSSALRMEAKYSFRTSVHLSVIS